MKRVRVNLSVFTSISFLDVVVERSFSHKSYAQNPQSICLSWRGVESPTIHSFPSSVVTTDVVYLALVVIFLHIEATLGK